MTRRKREPTLVLPTTVKLSEFVCNKLMSLRRSCRRLKRLILRSLKGLIFLELIELLAMLMSLITGVMLFGLLLDTLNPVSGLIIQVSLLRDTKVSHFN